MRVTAQPSAYIADNETIRQTHHFLKFTYHTFPIAILSNIPSPLFLYVKVSAYSPLPPIATIYLFVEIDF